MTLPHRRGLLLTAALLAAAPAASAADADKPDAYWVFLGTNGTGIYRSRLDLKTGKLAAPEPAAEVTRPSFLAISPNGKYLYAVGETSGKGGGGVFAFAVDPKAGGLTKLNETTSGGAGPCHVSVHPTGGAVAVANYGGGSTKVIVVEPDGKLSADKSSFVQHEGSGPNKARQERPHAHCSMFAPAGDFVLTVDLGIDRVMVFRYDIASGTLTNASDNITAPPGSGPRHIAVAPDGKFAYFCGELDSTVHVATLDLAGGKNEVVQSLSTLPQPVKGNSTAECILHPSGKFVYVSNRGHNSIAVFRVGEDRKLTAAGHVTGDIKTPRNFNVDPTGRWMLVASQDGNKVGVFEIDPATGLAKETGESVAVGKPVCVKFLAVSK